MLKLLIKEFNINFSISSDMIYSILPSPHILVKNAKLFNDNLDNPKDYCRKFDPMHLSPKGHKLVYNLIKDDELIIIEGRVSLDDYSGGNRLSAIKVYDLMTFQSLKASLLKISLNGQADALKLKELSYVHAEGYPAGEMKHGPLALIEEGMPVVVLAPRDSYYKKTISNMQEVIARGAKVLLITNKSKDEISSENIWETIEVESTNDDLLPFLLTIPLQKLAYYSALKKGYDIDKPRNLAKSVTVE